MNSENNLVQDTITDEMRERGREVLAKLKDRALADVKTSFGKKSHSADSLSRLGSQIESSKPDFLKTASIDDVDSIVIYKDSQGRWMAVFCFNNLPLDELTSELYWHFDLEDNSYENAENASGHLLSAIFFRIAEYEKLGR